MFKLTLPLSLVLILGLLIVGCDVDRTPTADNSPFVRLPHHNSITVPEGATLVSATLYLNAYIASGETVNVHNVTAPWVESEVTWNNFSGAYDAAVVNTFTPAAVGWVSVDITALANAWIEGTTDNYGVLLEQGASEYNRFFSSERDVIAERPKLELCFDVAGMTHCYTIQRGVLGEVADAYIWQLNPDYNTGSWTTLYTGLVEGYLKQSLLYFEMPVIMEYASLGDFVWHDLNRDGIQDEGEPGIEGVVVKLYDCENNLLGSTTTNAMGYYLFGNLDAGDYNVEFVLPAGYMFSLNNQGMNDAMDSDADIITGQAICTHLDAGEHDMTWDAGMYYIPQEGCTHTIGFWKTHAGFGPQADEVSQYLPIWLGTPGGTKSLQVTTAAMAVNILSMNTYGTSKNGITKLYAQLLGAKLSLADGADDVDIAAFVGNADAFLAMYNWTNWVGLSTANKTYVNDLKDHFDDYNNGLIGPGHCADDLILY